jgi:hypothetical protein
MSNNSFSIPGQEKQTLTPKSDREGINYWFLYKKDWSQRLGRHSGHRFTTFTSFFVSFFFVTTHRFGCDPLLTDLGGGEMRNLRYEGSAFSVNIYTVITW